MHFEFDAFFVIVVDRPMEAAFGRTLSLRESESEFVIGGQSERLPLQRRSRHPRLVHDISSVDSGLDNDEVTWLCQRRNVLVV